MMNSVISSYQVSYIDVAGVIVECKFITDSSFVYLFLCHKIKDVLRIILDLDHVVQEW